MKCCFLKVQNDPAVGLRSDLRIPHEPQVRACGFRLWEAIVITLVSVCTTTVVAEDETAKEDFFEKRIRPVLIKHCHECHSADAKKIQGGLLVDSREGLRKGGDSGPAVIPGDVDESLLISAIRHDGYEMPPSGRLPDRIINDFVQWISDGAVDPRTDGPGVPVRSSIDIEAGRKHWAYQPVRRPNVPEVNAADWPSNEIDHFILARLELINRHPVGDADRMVLARRLWFALTGLPPEPDELEAFLNDQSPQAYESLVERLLDSPRFGERWGRHWLDVVRYAESVTLRGLILDEAWRYRDYVVESFNHDRPFNQFLTEQIAGDLLTEDDITERRRQLTATTFLTMGNSNLEDQDKNKLEMDYVDEQLDVIGRGLMAQTITCARCHDHKFDPIPTRDYYAMAGILKNVQALKHSNVSTWVEVPLPVNGELRKKIDDYRGQEKALQAEIAELKKELKSLTDPAEGHVVQLEDLKGIVVDDSSAKRTGTWMDSSFVSAYVAAGYCHDQAEMKGDKSVTFEPELPSSGRYEVRVSYSPGANRARRVPITVFSADGEKTVHIDQTKSAPINGLFISIGTFAFDSSSSSRVVISTQGTTGHVIADAVQFLPLDQPNNPDQDKPEDPLPSRQRAQQMLVESMQKQLKQKENRLKKLRRTTPVEPMVISVREQEQGNDLAVHIRGSVLNLGPVVPRGVMQVVTYGEAPRMPEQQSGRLELARWLTSDTHPLTARVIVNRTWHWLFGEGLVRTVDNFGTTGEEPSHPELLDFLADQFVRDGWSMKRLIRRIVMSRTYRLASSGDSLAEDPGNRLLSHTNRMRLDAESLRDAMLAQAGQLDLTMGGKTFPDSQASDYNFTADINRRSVYLPVFRNSLPEIFEVFDFPNPSMVTGRRNVSTVAPQALFLMNHPSIRKLAEQTAKRLLKDHQNIEARLIDSAYVLVLGRPVTDRERDLTDRFVAETTEKETQLEAWTQVIHSLFASLEYRYVR